MVAAEGRKLIVAKGLEDFIVVDTPDALLICPRDDEQWVKQLVSRSRRKTASRWSDAAAETQRTTPGGAVR